MNFVEIDQLLKNPELYGMMHCKLYGTLFAKQMKAADLAYFYSTSKKIFRRSEFEELMNSVRFCVSKGSKLGIRHIFKPSNDELSSFFNRNVRQLIPG